MSGLLCTHYTVSPMEASLKAFEVQTYFIVIIITLLEAIVSPLLFPNWFPLRETPRFGGTPEAFLLPSL